MASYLVPSSHIHSCPWIPVVIGDSRFLCKSWFGQTQYHVLLMDSVCLWEEHMEAEDIQARAQELNRRLRASFESLYSHLVTVVTPCLTGSGGDHGTGVCPDPVTLQQADGRMMLRLKSELAGLPFYWEFHCHPAPVSAACVQLVRPLLVMSMALQKQVALLFKQLQRKDAEIQDYRENGAQLTRERLQTEPFEEEAFRQDFMSKMLPLLLDHQEAPLDLDSDLQGLFSCIVSQLSSAKRKRQNSVEEGPPPEAEETSALTLEQQRDGAADVKLSQKEEKKTTLPIIQQSKSSSLTATERPAPKPKKKKVGLFR